MSLFKVSVIQLGPFPRHCGGSALEGHLQVNLHREVSLTTGLLLQTCRENWPLKGLKG